MRKCPFCGSSGELKEYTACYGHGDYATETHVRCIVCGATGETFSDWDFSIEECKQKAVAAWNNRKEENHGEQDQDPEHPDI